MEKVWREALDEYSKKVAKRKIQLAANLKDHLNGWHSDYNNENCLDCTLEVSN